MCSGFGSIGSGTRSVILMPNPDSPPFLAGLLVSMRIVVMPRSTRIWAPMPYSRLSTGRAQLEVGAHRVVALLLETVGLELVADADATAFVAPVVQDDAPALLGHLAH